MRVELRRPGANGGYAVWIAEWTGTMVVVKYGKQGSKLNSTEYPSITSANAAASTIRKKANAKLAEGKGYEVYSEDYRAPAATTPATTAPEAKPTTPQDSVRLRVPSDEKTHEVLMLLTAIFDYTPEITEDDEGWLTGRLGGVDEELFVHWTTCGLFQSEIRFIDDNVNVPAKSLAFVAAAALRLGLRVPYFLAEKRIIEDLSPDEVLDMVRSDLPESLVSLLVEAKIYDDGNLLVGAFACA